MNVTQPQTQTYATTLERSPATTFLFDPQRTGRTPVSHTHPVAPKTKWSFSLRSNPTRGVETAPVIDEKGNIFFGSHDGCIYSVNSEGKIKWMYKTGAKVYASPLLLNAGEVVFSGGDGFVYCFTTGGDLRWKFDMCPEYRGLSRKRRALHLLPQLSSALDIPRRRVRTILSWASPNLSISGEILAVAQGHGLRALGSDGQIEQKYKLGWPDFHHSGVAVDKFGNVFVASQRNRMHCLTPAIELKWSRPAPARFESWGNPSILPERELVAFPLARGEHAGKVCAYDTAGSPRWESDLPGGIRGSVTWLRTMDGIACTLHGNVCLICGETGRVKASAKLTNAKRGLWTSATIDSQNRILLTTKDSNYEGSLCCLNDDLSTRWRIPIGKSLSPPVFDANGNIYVGSWDGTFKCFASE